MEYETEEQQVEALKEWWAENGRAVIAGVVLGGSVIGGWTFWNSYQEKQIVAASDAFSQSMDSINASDKDATLGLADELQDDRPKHLYASYANFAAARIAVENEDLEEAKNRLQWVVDNAPQDDVKLIAQVRLARVVGAIGDASTALGILPTSFPDSFVGLIEEARGDLLLATGDTDGARLAYESAAASQYVANREGLNMKLDDLAASVDEADDSDNTESAS